MHTHLSVADLLQIGTLLTFLTPYIAAIFTQAHLPRWANDLIAIGVSIVAGIVTFLTSGGTFDNIHDVRTLGVVIVAIITAARIYYVKLAKATPLIDAIEYYTGAFQRGVAKPASIQPSQPDADPLPIGTTDTDSPVEPDADPEVTSDGS